MNFARNRNFWISVAAGSFLAAAVFTVRKRARREAHRTHGDPSRLAWRFDHQFRTLPGGDTLRVATQTPAVVHWTVNQWDSVEDTHTTEIMPGVYIADLATESLPPGTRVQFTFYWPGVNRWEGEDFDLRIEAASERMWTAKGTQG
jgi:hypothetical protein